MAEVLLISKFNFSIYSGNYNLFRGFSVYTWILVVTQAFSGIFIGFVMKYASSILRLFIISSATIVTTLLSVLIFGLILKVTFLFSAGLVIYAVILYHLWVFQPPTLSFPYPPSISRLPFGFNFYVPPRAKSSYLLQINFVNTISTTNTNISIIINIVIIATLVLNKIDFYMDIRTSRKLANGKMQRSTRFKSAIVPESADFSGYRWHWLLSLIAKLIRLLLSLESCIVNFSDTISAVSHAEVRPYTLYISPCVYRYAF